MRAGGIILALLLAVAAGVALASEGEEARDILHVEHPPAPAEQPTAQADAKSSGCLSCHHPTDEPTMHRNPAVVLGCTDCHGGDAAVAKPETAAMDTPEYDAAKEQAHVQPRYPETWAKRAPGNPERSYTLLNKEAPEFIRFVNPGDLRVARAACGACHGKEVAAVERSLMSSGAMLWGGASYNNGILPFKRYILGEAYYTPTRDECAEKGDEECKRITLPGKIVAARSPTQDEKVRGVLQQLIPLPAWETTPPADIFRVFERGGLRNITQFPEIGLPNRDEEPGKPDIRASNRGPGTGARISVPVLNVTKTRLNDPFLWFLGTNDNPGDFRSSGCTSCHAVYANDRDWFSSGSYAKYGHWGQTVTSDPTIKDRLGPDGEKERGHPLRHAFTRAIPTAQCMNCHMHQPNVFLNSYLGFTMWDYESDAPLMWPEQQRFPSIEEMHRALERNPEEAVIRGKWSDLDFVSNVWTDINPKAKDTQFADYHGHGWNFRAIFKRSRDGTLLDKDGEAVPDTLPPEEKWKRAVHMRDIHTEYGMQCADCHFAQDSHGDGNLYGEVAQAIEIRCQDCHGTVDSFATLRTSGPAAPPGGTDLSLIRNEDGRLRFEWREEDGRRVLYQRNVLAPYQEWAVSQVKDSVTPGNPHYNEKSARAKTIAKGSSMAWGAEAEGCARAHDDEKMACFSCHSSWMTSCAGCHLPIQANWKTTRHHYEGGETRNFATYNPQVARDQMFQLGKHGPAKKGIIVPVRSSSALVLSSTDINRNRIYIQQQPVSAGGYSAQAFAPHFPHTVRKTETKTCTDCHVSEANDNNAIMAQLLLLGTSFVNFVGFNAWVGTEDGIDAVQVTEWDEPQAVIGSYLHRYAYPKWFADHQERGQELQLAHHHHAEAVRCIQQRGEYLYAAEGEDGLQVYDIASIANKAFSERFITAPFSPLGQDTGFDSKDATCVALPTNQLLRPERNRVPGVNTANPDPSGVLDNLEQPMHPIYSYAAVTDAEEGLILTNVETLADLEPRNNFLSRALTWNPDGILDGAVHAFFAGHLLYVSAKVGLVVVDLDVPLEPKLVTVIPLQGAGAAVQQFRYVFVLTAGGLEVVDVTHPERPRVVPEARVPIADARGLYVARTYAYVAAGAEGLVIVDVEKPEAPRVLTKYDAGGRLRDAHDVVVGSTNASLFAYVADGENGLAVLQLTSPDSQPKFYGFSPEPRPELIAWRHTNGAALSLSRGLERDRAVDETGHQVAVFGRIGSRPFNLPEMQELYLDEAGGLFTVSDDARPGGQCRTPGAAAELSAAVDAGAATSP
jgi:hypothetical protein